MIIIASLIFDWMQALLNKLPNNMGENIWILTAFILILSIVIVLMNPSFFRFYMSNNHIFDWKEFDFAEDAPFRMEGKNVVVNENSRALF